MKTKYLLLFLPFLFCAAYGKMPTVSVSPFIIRGFSYTFTLSNFMILDYNSGNRNNYGHWSETEHLDRNRTIFDSRMFYENSWFANDFFSVGIKDKAEIEFMLGLSLTISSQVKINAFNYGNSREFFRNISISPFAGQFFQRSVHNYEDFYCGISIGTRKIPNNRLLLEVYSSPMIYKSKYTILANNTNPLYYGKAEFLTLNLPIGSRMLKGGVRKFSWDFGITPVIHLRETWLETNPFAIFSKFSFHLGRKR
jgi:hypothetical protein